MSTASVTRQVIPKGFPKFMHRYVGNSRLFESLKPFEKYSVVAYLNSVYNVAPLFKWSLSIVPLYGIFVGNPPVEKVDFNSSAALCATGIVWCVYALLIQPQNAGSRSLALLNLCLAFVNGYNCYRSWSYNQQKKTEAVKDERSFGWPINTRDSNSSISEVPQKDDKT
ncbi:Mitochondrial pyruvate carrier [Trypanosoma melophagium]|uniref:Mitochondrial pyruvate carrier n=1 Tax=Trypanosoma melophagium TaxID=715481 RepID=UPI00351A95CD|nr:Mitochondrial pyruvate carrier [Trypanosoma melophagium]